MSDDEVTQTNIKSRSYKDKYSHQRDNAKLRGIDFNLTYEEWLDWWVESGRLEERGNKRGQYVMARIDDTGPYCIDNIKCVTVTENQNDAHLGRKDGKHPSKVIEHPKTQEVVKRIEEAKEQSAQTKLITVEKKLNIIKDNDYKKRSNKQKSFYSDARIAVEQVKLIREVIKSMVNNTDYEDLSEFFKELQSMLDGIEDPGSIRKQKGHD